MAPRCGRMVASMRESGKLIRLMASEGSFMRMAMFIMATGSMMKLMDLAPLSEDRFLNIPVFGRKTSKMDLELKIGLMELSSMAHIVMVKRMELASSNGAMVPVTSVISSTTTFMARVPMPGVMSVNTRGSGSTTKCMVSALSGGRMVVNT